MSLKRFFEGIRFGLVLQLAIGPMAMLTFNTAKNAGFLVAFSLVIAIVLVDAFYISLVCIGAGTVLEKPAAKNVMRYVGSAVLMLFGLNMILGAFGINLIPALNVAPSSRSVFIQGIVLTLSNPGTIIFWGGILASKIAGSDFSRGETYSYAFGVWCTSLFALTLIALLGLFLSRFISPSVSVILNAVVGLFLIGFGLRILFKKQ